MLLYKATPSTAVVAVAAIKYRKLLYVMPTSTLPRGIIVIETRRKSCIYVFLAAYFMHR